jgi:hypothetical protein
MKFKDYLKESDTQTSNDQEINEWLFNHMHVFTPHDFAMTIMGVKDGTFQYTQKALDNTEYMKYGTANKMLLSFNTRSAARDTSYNWQPPTNDGNKLFANVVNLELEKFYVHGFKNIASSNMESIFFHDCEIKSWDNLREFSGLREFKFDYRTFDDSEPAPLISIMRLPRLEKLHIYIPSNIAGRDFVKKAADVKNIIEKHIADKNIADCMDELMEAGFKEYAK